MFKFTILLISIIVAIGFVFQVERFDAGIERRDAPEHHSMGAQDSPCTYVTPAKIKDRVVESRSPSGAFNAKSLGVISHLSSGWTLADPVTREPVLDEDGDTYFFRLYGAALDTLETTHIDGVIIRAYTIH